MISKEWKVITREGVESEGIHLVLDYWCSIQTRVNKKCICN